MTKYEKGSFGYFIELAKRDGFDNIKGWSKWKNRKTNKISKYNPCSEEFQEEAKKLGMTGYQYAQKLIREGKLPNPTEVERKRLYESARDNGFKSAKEYRDNLAQKKGYNDNADYKRELCYNKGISSPSSENECCSLYLGNVIGENIAIPILIDIFGCIKERMPSKNPGYDYIVNGTHKVDVKTAILKLDSRNGNYIWPFHIDHNGIIDYFLLLALDDIINKNLIHVWLINKNEMIRKGVGTSYVLEKFYIRDKITIRDNHEILLEFEKYDWINKLKCLDVVTEILKNIS